MLCSILIPSRGRPEKLMNTIQSFREQAEGNNFEFWIRFDDDDAPSLTLLPSLEAQANVHVLVGPRGRGYADINGIMYRDLERAANGDWMWIMNDDAVIEGEGWDTILDCVPQSGFIVQPELHKLGGSTYHKDHGSGFPCYPRLCWKTLGMPEYPDPCDAILPPFLHSKGWHTYFLPDVAIWHQRNKPG